MRWRQNGEAEIVKSAGAMAVNDREPSLLDIMDHVLNAGIVIQGSIVISLAGVDLIYLGLNAVLTSVETALKHIRPRPDDAVKG